MGIRIQNQTNDSAEIVISGNIIDDDNGGFIEEWYSNTTGYQWPEKIRKQLDDLQGKDLTIYINSDGGSVPAGVAIANMIHNHDGHTKAIVEGWCCSIATQIFFSADEREMPSNTYLMIHKPSAYSSGNSNDMKKTAEILDTIQEGLEKIYINCALDGITAEKIHSMVESETWLTGDEASKIFNINKTEPIQVAACAGKGLNYMNKTKIPYEIVQQQKMALKKTMLDKNNDKYKAEIALALAKGAMLK